MKKTLYLAIITLITIGCIIYRTHDIFGNTSNNINIGIVNPEYTTNEDIVLDAFDSIYIDAEVMDITLNEGTSYSLTYKATDDFDMNYRIENNTLIIEQRKIKQGLSFNTSNAFMTLTVPQNTTLTKVDNTVDVGDITYDNLTSNELISNSDVGDIDIQKCTIKNITIDSDTGDVNISSSTFDNIDVQTDIGDAELENCDLKYALINSNTGGIEFDKCSFNNLELSSDIGDINIESSKHLDDFSYDLETDIGDVEVNDKNYEDEYKSYNGKNNITAHASTGDITINS